MRYLYICNTTRDCINKIDANSFSIEENISLKGINRGKIGPHGLCIQGETLFTSNCYDGSVSIIDLESLKSESYYLGRNCRDLCAIGNHIYIICGDSNNVVNFDISKREIVELIPCGNAPHSIDYCSRTNQIVVANMNDDSITLFDALYGCNIKNIKVGPFPTKALISRNGDYILVCESNMGYSDKGSISIISSKTFKLINRTPVGNCPFDMHCDEKYCYVSNYGEGSISLIDMDNFKEVDKIRIGGMPRGIVCDDEFMYVGDSYNDVVLKIHKKSNGKIIIPLKGEPTGMILK